MKYLLLLAGLSISVASGAPVKPNIIVIYTDDHGYSDLGCQGVMKDVKTPNIDGLAAGGVRMTDGHVTAPQCGPSRAGLITGSLVVERIFNLPGLGKFFVISALQRDYTVVMGMVIFYAALILVLNLIADLLYAMLDPRVKLA